MKRNVDTTGASGTSEGGRGPSPVQVPVYGRGGVQEATALLDPADAVLAAARWRLMPRGYAIHQFWHGGVPQNVQLHRAVLGLLPGDRRVCIFRNDNKLDCRRSNLVAAPHRATWDQAARRAALESDYEAC